MYIYTCTCVDVHVPSKTPAPTCRLWGSVVQPLAGVLYLSLYMLVDGIWRHCIDMGIHTCEYTVYMYIYMYCMSVFCLEDYQGRSKIVSSPDCHVFPVRKTVWPFSKDFLVVLSLHVQKMGKPISVLV